MQYKIILHLRSEPEQTLNITYFNVWHSRFQGFNVKI